MKFGARKVERDAENKNALTELNGNKKIQKNPERMNIEEIMDSTLFKKLIQS